MEEANEQDANIRQELKAYLETYIKLCCYQCLEKASLVIATIVVKGLVFICMMTTFLFASLVLALYLSDVFGTLWKGFGCVMVIYSVISLVICCAKQRCLSASLANVIIRKIFEKESL